MLALNISCLVHCWLKFKGAPKWQLSIANSIKTASIGIKEEADDRIDPIKEQPKKVRRGFRGRKCEGEKEKKEGTEPRMTSALRKKQVIQLT